MTKQTFDNFLRDNLSLTAYEGLPDLLNESPKMVTMRIAAPEKLTAFQLNKIVKELKRFNPLMNTQFIIDRFVNQEEKETTTA